MVQWKSLNFKDILVFYSENLEFSNVENEDILIKKCRGVKCSSTEVNLAKNVNLQNYDDYYLLRVDTKEINIDYLINYLIAKNPMDDFVESKGMLSKLNFLSFIDKTMIPLPNLEQQNRIVVTCQQITDKIRINHAINKTLQEMSQVLYSKLAGNRSQPFSRIATSSFSFAEVTPLTHKYIENILVAKDFSDDEYGEKLIYWGDISQADFLLQSECTFGRNDYTIIKAKSGISPLFVYCATKNILNEQHSNNISFDKLTIANFSHETMLLFHNTTNSWYHKIQNNYQENVMLDEYKQKFMRLL
ncbi:hypothetical protein [Candidatus Uabimicrobium sp. HlEnr_7]|uniref:hypothetical protein n=1 Tax=Candidatus Uabimicrobium helgolandensis TaxID=3095367 RepID=UPI003558463B